MKKNPVAKTNAGIDKIRYSKGGKSLYYKKGEM